MPSETAENYLKALFHLGNRGTEPVRTKDLAERIGVRLPSATNMVKALSDRGLATWRPYRGAELTEAGRLEALRVIRKHRLIEVFLVRTLEMGWDEVHAEAERLEHAVSDRLLDRIDAMLGHPQSDPHGDPIPTAEGTLQVPEGVWLKDCEEGTSWRLVRVHDQEAALLRYLASKGLVPGAEIIVLEVEPFEGPIHVRTDEGESWLARSVVARLLVTPVERASRSCSASSRE